MTAEEYKEIGDQLDALLRVYRDELATDERVRRSLHEALETCRVRYDDAQKGRK